MAERPVERAALLRRATSLLADKRPAFSARRVLTRGQALFFGMLAAAVVAAAFAWPEQTAAIVVTGMSFGFLQSLVLRCTLALLGRHGAAPCEPARDGEGPYTYNAYGLCMSGASGCPDTGVAYRYTGRRYDAETGLYYYRARYYSPKLGRFLQTDAAGYKDDLNWYAYVGNDPTDKTDPSGNGDLFSDLIAAAPYIGLPLTNTPVGPLPSIIVNNKAPDAPPSSNIEGLLNAAKDFAKTIGDNAGVSASGGDLGAISVSVSPKDVIVIMGAGGGEDAHITLDANLHSAETPGYNGGGGLGVQVNGDVGIFGASGTLLMTNTGIHTDVTVNSGGEGGSIVAGPAIDIKIPAAPKPVEKKVKQ